MMCILIKMLKPDQQNSTVHCLALYGTSFYGMPGVRNLGPVVLYLD